MMYWVTSKEQVRGGKILTISESEENTWTYSTCSIKVQAQYLIEIARVMLCAGTAGEKSDYKKSVEL